MDDNPPPLDPILFRNASAPPEILDDNAEILDDSDDEDIPQRPYSSLDMNRNPAGKNGYAPCPPASDPTLAAALQEYHREGLTNYAAISARLKAEHNINMSAGTVKNRLRQLKLFASNKTSKIVSESRRRQMVMDELATDPNMRRGPKNIREGILSKSNVLLGRDFIENQMRINQPEGFALREPTAKRIPRGTLEALGPHDAWSGDGHDKLAKIGFPIYGIRDVWSGKWLGLWVVPNNRLGTVVAYLYLSLVHELGGIPNQMTTDCGSETTQMYALANALRKFYAPEIEEDDIHAHQYLKSVHNIVIERGWLRLRLEWGDAIATIYKKGLDEGIYDDTDELHCTLVRWVWPEIIKKSLADQKAKMNRHKGRKQILKSLPSGTSSNSLMANPTASGGVSQLRPIDRAVVRKYMDEDLGGADILKFVDDDFALQCQNAWTTIHSPKLIPENGWAIFKAILPHVHM